MNEQLSPVLTAERRAAIARMVAQGGVARVAALADRFAVDASTIRRDLAALERRGQLRRVHGGAVAVEAAPPAALVDVGRQAETRGGALSPAVRIGQTAAGLMADGETVFLGPGTLTLEVARALVTSPSARAGLTVVTNGLEVAHWVARHSAFTVIVTGGQVQGSDLGLEGALTRAALASLRADHVVMELGGVSAVEGVTDDSLSQAEVARTLFRTGAETIVLVPPERVGRVAAAFVAPASDVDVVVTAREAASPYLWDLTELGVRVIMA